MSKQHDELEAPAAMEKRLGIAAKTRKAAKKYAGPRERTDPIARLVAVADFTAGAAWERRRRAKDGY